MQLVIHSPFGSRVNRAWGLALRKRFCRAFNFELQAAATEDAIVLSLTTAHSFALDEVARYLHSNTVRPLLVQALCAAPMFPVRWRWSATIALALPRFRGGRKVPAPLARMAAEDLLAVGVPRPGGLRGEPLAASSRSPITRSCGRRSAIACRRRWTSTGLEALLRGLESGAIRAVARDLTEPSPLALEVLSARPYAFLDDAPARGAAHAGGVEPPLARSGGGGRPRRSRSRRHRAGARGGVARCRRLPTSCTMRSGLAHFHDRRPRSASGRTGRAWVGALAALAAGPRVWLRAARRSGSPPSACRCFRLCCPDARPEPPSVAPAEYARPWSADGAPCARLRAAGCRASARSPPPPWRRRSACSGAPDDVGARGAAGGRVR